MKNRAVVAIGAMLLAGATGTGGWYLAANGLRVVNWCDVTDCPPLPIGLSPLRLILCCNYVTGDCVLVSSLSECHPEYEYAVICEHGASAPVEGGTECYD